MARGGDDVEAVALRGRGTGWWRRRARARSRCTSRRRRGGSPASVRAARERRRRAGSSQLLAGGRTSAVHAGVAELEALVDQREVGQQVAGGGVRERRPVGVGAGAQVHAARRASPSSSTAQTVAPRGLSTRPTPTSTAASLRVGRARRASGRPAARSSRSKVASSSTARSREPRGDVAGRRVRRGRGRSRRRRAAGLCAAHVVADAGGAGRRPDGAEPVRRRRGRGRRRRPGVPGATR